MTSASLTAARVAMASAIAALLALASLHLLSPEFDPSWRMVSEYANGHYGWLLSLMFVAWGLSSWALAVAISSEVLPAGVIGLVGWANRLLVVVDCVWVVTVAWHASVLHDSGKALLRAPAPRGAMEI